MILRSGNKEGGWGDHSAHRYVACGCHTSIGHASERAGAEHAGLSPDQVRNQSSSAKRGDMSGESSEGQNASCYDYSARSKLIVLHMDDCDGLVEYLISPLPETIHGLYSA